MIEGELLQWARDGRRASAVLRGDGRWTLDYGRRMRVLTIGLLVVCLPLFGLLPLVGAVALYRQRGDLVGAGSIGLIGAPFLFMCRWLYVDVFRARVSLDRDGLTFDCPWRRRCSVAWSEVRRVTHSPGFMWFAIETAQGTFRVSELRDGLGTLRRFLEERVPRWTWAQAAPQLPSEER